MRNPRRSWLPVLLLAFACGKSSPGKHAPESGEPPSAVSDATNGEADGEANADAKTTESPLQLSVGFSLTSGEHSKDSHSQRYTCQIQAGRVTYSGPYGECERGQCEHKTVTFPITNGQAKALLDEVERLGLFATFEEVRETSLLGHFYELSWTVTGEEASGAIRVAGMSKAWGKDPSQNLSDKAKHWVERARAFRHKLLQLVKPHLPDAH